MPDPDYSSLSRTSTGNAGHPPDTTTHSNDRRRQPRSHRVLGVALALVGAAILVISLQYFLFHPMTQTAEYIGSRMWLVGSWLLGGGVTLTFARPLVAALVAFFSPALTFVMAMLLYFAMIFLAPLFS